MTTIMMATLGAMESHGSENRYFLPRTTIRPQLALGGCAPTPRKLKDASDKIADGIFKVNSTIRDGMQFGRMCRNMMTHFFTPMLRAASTYSFSFKERVWERTMRAVPAQFTRLNAMKILIRPPPMVYMTTIASSSDGNASITSARRMMMKSTLPP